MIAGAICEETDCTGLALILLAVLLAVAAVVTVVVVAWIVTISTILRRRGWGAASRRTVAVVSATIAAALLWALATAFPDVGGVGVLAIALLAVPVAIWQRRVTRRSQSSPCSTA